MLDTMISNSLELSVQNCMAPAVPIVTRRTGVDTALHLLWENCLPALPLVENGYLTGLVFEKDLLRLAPSEATTLDRYELHEVLDRLNVGRVVRRVAALSPAASLREALLHMGHERLEAVPVAAGDCYVGLLTWPALLLALGDEIEH